MSKSGKAFAESKNPMKPEGWIMKNKWLFSVAAAVIALQAASYSAIAAVAASSGTVTTALPVTLSVSANNTDVTDSWLTAASNPLKLTLDTATSPYCVAPCYHGPLLTLTTANMTSPQFSLVTSGTSRSSNYPGVCTNFGNNSDTSPDFYLSGNQAVALDCGGTLVVSVTGLVRNTAGAQVSGTFTFVWPPDFDTDGMPDAWESQYCAGAPDPRICLSPSGDDEVLGNNTARGDGWSNFDEWRGLIVSGQQIRTDPKNQKDLYVHLLNPQCSRTGTTPTLGITGSFLEKYPVDARYSVDGTSIFGPFTTLGGSAPVALHFIGFQDRHANGSTNEWVDNLSSFTISGGSTKFTYTDGTISLYNGTTPNIAVTDRRVDKNAVYPILVSGNRTIQKGLRIIECLDDSASSPIGYAFFQSGQHGNPDVDTNSVFYSQRIYNDYANALNLSNCDKKGTCGPSAYRDCALGNTLPWCVYFSTYQNSAWPAGAKTYTDSSGRTQTVDRNFIHSNYLRFIVGMELGHGVDLYNNLQTQQYGAHFAPGTGDALDARIVAKDSSTLRGVLYQIPSAFGDLSNAGFNLHDQ